MYLFHFLVPTPFQHNHSARTKKGESSNNFNEKGNVLALVSK
jgi:hypothetical protein